MTTPATDKQMAFLRKLAAERGVDPPSSPMAAPPGVTTASHYLPERNTT